MTTNKQLRASDKELDRYLYVGIAQVEEDRDRYKAECEKLAEMLELFVSNPTPTSEDFDKAHAAIVAYREQGESK